MRTVSFDIPPQEILTKDSVTVAVDAVVYYRIADSQASVTNVEDAAKSTKLLAQVSEIGQLFIQNKSLGTFIFELRDQLFIQTTLRTMLGTRTLTAILADREEISSELLSTLDKATDVWGIKVSMHNLIAYF